MAEEKKVEQNNKVLEFLKKHILVVCIIVVLILGFLIFRVVFLSKLLNTAQEKIDFLTAQKEEITLVSEKEKKEMQDQIALLSNQVAEQLAKEEEEAAKHYPNGLPVTGKVTISTQPEEIPEEGAEGMSDDQLRQMVIFGAQHGAKVMAAGSGKVISVKKDEEFGYAVRIDHGNGYITIYRYNDTPKIKEGDDVSKGQLLFEVNFVTSKVGYQVMYDNAYINPMDVMEVNG